MDYLAIESFAGRVETCLSILRVNVDLREDKAKLSNMDYFLLI